MHDLTPRPEALKPAEMLPSFRRRLWRGSLSAAGLPVAWLGRFCGPLLARLQTPERRAHGLAIILPGIESQSFLNHSVAWGLLDGGFPGAIEVDDWTTGNTFLFPYHLRGRRRNTRQAERLADKIRAYQAEHPGRPVTLIGHSGGGAISVFALERLGAPIARAILLGPALSPQYPLGPALQRTEHGIWNFYSAFDAFFLGLGTLALGTIDGRHTISAGACGFRIPESATDAERGLYASRLTQVPFARHMLRQFNLGGHFGYTNRLFVAETVAPLLVARSA